MAELNSGNILNGRFLLNQLLGSGSFGEVWLAEDTLTHRQVAIKVYISLDPAGVEEFRREYLTMADVASEYLLNPVHFDIYCRRPFLVMRYCEGGASSRLAGNISEEKLWSFIYDVACGLNTLHTLQDPIVHQDIKPDNILIDTNGFKITDFGISKHLKATMRRQSRRDATSGAIPYMAPERFTNTSKLYTASDIWSLGASIYELATGELPFNGFGGSMQRNGADMPILGQQFSRAINQLMQNCLALEPADRPTAHEIMEWAQKRSVPTSKANNPLVSQSNPNYQNLSDKHSSRAIKFYLPIAVGVVAFILIGFLFFQNKNKVNDMNADVVNDSIIPIVESVENIDTPIPEITNEVVKPSLSDTYNTYSIGDGSISVPTYLKYMGQSDDGGPFFSDGKTYLYVDYASGQDLDGFHWFCTNEIGNGNPAYDSVKANQFVQSGHNYEGNIYYTKAYMDYRSNPAIIYTATLIYPESEREKNNSVIAKSFKTFPNLK